MTWGNANRAIAAIAAVKFCLHLYANRHYGYFVDELYYLACSRHLAWGYVDHPPLIALITWLETRILGDSLPAIRFLPAAAGAGEIVLTALIARQMGGGAYAQGFAALTVLVAPGLMAGNNLLTMNAFEPVIWLGCAWLVLRIINTSNPRYWLGFGLLAGTGLQNKHSMLIFGAGIVVGLVLTPERRWLKSPWLWAGGAIAVLVFLPNLLWNIQHQFPFLELQANIRRSGRNVSLGPLAFFGEQVLTLDPLNALIWLAGLWFLFLTWQGKPYRVLGWAWIFTALTVLTMNPRVYYLYPAMPLLLAAGSVRWEQGLQRKPVWRKWAWPAALAITGALLAPLALPLLPPESYIRYSKALHAAPPAIEAHRLGPLPQIFADQFGWEEMTAKVAEVYNSLPADVRGRTAIFARNYGQAGAIDLFGPKYGLPPAISGHQNYFFWGPRAYTGESVIVLQGNQQDLERSFASVAKAARVDHPYSMPYEHFDIYYCRGLRQPLKDVWPKVKNWN
ncbi:MAG: glycosyltransferase family 39 protein [Bryobacterales bacterium]|nr:glycosyltransferase family 39 protein [Bryobacterales bacterium]